MRSLFLKTHYRTVILVCCFLALFVNQGLASTSFNVYQTYIVQIPQVGDAGGALVITIRTFVSLISMAFVGFYYKHLSTRAGLFIASLLTAIGFAVYGLVEFDWSRSLLILCIGSVFTGIGYGLGGIVASTALIGQWFRGHIGGTAGIAGTGSGIAAVLIPIAAADIIGLAGLSVSFYAESALALALAIALLALVRSTPEEIGAVPYETKDHFANIRKGRIQIISGDIPKTDRICATIAVFLLGCVSVAGLGYFSILMTSSGINVIAAAVITSVLGAVLTVSKILSGLAFDIMGTRNGSLVFFVILVIGFVLCFGIQSGSATDAFFAAVFFGCGTSLSTTGLAVWAVELSSMEQRMGFLKNLSVAFALGGFLMNMVPGILVSLFGNYGISYLLFAALAIISGILIFTVYTKKMKADEGLHGPRMTVKRPRSRRAKLHRERMNGK